MQMVADMWGVGVKNRGKFADILCGRPLYYYDTSGQLVYVPFFGGN